MMTRDERIHQIDRRRRWLDEIFVSWGATTEGAGGKSDRAAELANKAENELFSITPDTLSGYAVQRQRLDELKKFKADAEAHALGLLRSADTFLFGATR
jgi:hypothetical protein